MINKFTNKIDEHTELTSSINNNNLNLTKAAMPQHNIELGGGFIYTNTPQVYHRNKRNTNPVTLAHFQQHSSCKETQKFKIWFQMSTPEATSSPNLRREIRTANTMKYTSNSSPCKATIPVHTDNLSDIISNLITVFQFLLKKILGIINYQPTLKSLTGKLHTLINPLTSTLRLSVTIPSFWKYALTMLFRVFDLVCTSSSLAFIVEEMLGKETLNANYKEEEKKLLYDMVWQDV